MAHLHLAPHVSILRLYDEPNGYEKRLPYKATVMVTHCSDTHVYLGAAVGEVNAAAWSATMELLKEQGVATVEYERHGQMKTRIL